MIFPKKTILLIGGLFLSFSLSILLNASHLGFPLFLELARYIIVFLTYVSVANFILQGVMSIQQVYRILLLAAVPSAIAAIISGASVALNVSIPSSHALLFNGTRSSVLFADPNYYANVLLIPLSISVYGFLFKVTWKKSYLSLMLLFSISIVLSKSRSGIGAMLVIWAIYLIMYSQKRVKKTADNEKRVSSISKMLIGVPLIAGVLLKLVLDREAPLWYSILDRVELWSQGIEVWLKHPFFGVGPGNYLPYLRMAKMSGFGGFRLDAVHNTFISLLATNGVSGVLLLGAIVAFSLQGSFSKIGEHKTEQKIATVTVTGLLCQGLFIEIATARWLWVFLGILVAVKINQSRLESSLG